MTLVSSSTSTLKTLMALYENENKPSGNSGGTLTSDQIGSIDSMLSGSSTDSGASDTVDTLLGSSTAGSTDISSILDEIEAKQAVANSTSTSSSDGSSPTTTTQTPQQKAASLMQSVYQSQQNNLFTLIG